MKIANPTSTPVVAITFLLLTAAWDCAATYLTVGHRLDLDGNPVIRGFNWNQLLLLQFVAHAVIIAAFLWAWGRQKAIWPDTEMPFLRFLQYRIKKGFALRFNAAHLKREMVYAGLILMWSSAVGHFLAALITTVPLVGGPSFVDFFRMFGVTDLRLAQRIVMAALVLAAFLVAHYPLYVSYSIAVSSEKGEKGA